MIHVALTCDWLVSGDSISPVATVWQLLAVRSQLHPFFSWFIYFFHLFFFFQKRQTCTCSLSKTRRTPISASLSVCHAGTHVMREWTPSSTKLITARAYNLWTSAAPLVCRRWSAECKKSANGRFVHSRQIERLTPVWTQTQSCSVFGTRTLSDRKPYTRCTRAPKLFIHVTSKA